MLDDDWIGAVLANGGRHAFLEMVAPSLVFCINAARQVYLENDYVVLVALMVGVGQKEKLIF